MGKTDRKMKDYFSDKRRYADLWNGSVFGGRQIVCADNLQEDNAVVTLTGEREDSETADDVSMKHFHGGHVLALWMLENQKNTDYSMPARVMLEEALQYGRQLREIRRKNRKEYADLMLEKTGRENRYYKNSGEFLYRFKKTDRLFPVFTLVVYWGEEEWDGPLNLTDMINFGEDESVGEELRHLVPTYPVRFIDLTKIEDYSVFKTELRTLLELYACRNDDKKFAEYLETHEECLHLDEETCHMLGVMTHFRQLQKIKPEKKEDGINMCGEIQTFGFPNTYKLLAYPNYFLQRP